MAEQLGAGTVGEHGSAARAQRAKPVAIRQQVGVDVAHRRKRSVADDDQVDIRRELRSNLVGNNCHGMPGMRQSGCQRHDITPIASYPKLVGVELHNRQLTHRWFSSSRKPICFRASIIIS